MTTDNFCFYLQNRLIQTGQTGGQWYSDTSPFSIPWLKEQENWDRIHNNSDFRDLKIESSVENIVSLWKNETINNIIQ